MDSLLKTTHNATSPSSIDIYVQSDKKSSAKSNEGSLVNGFSTQEVLTDNLLRSFKDQENEIWKRKLDQLTQNQLKRRYSLLYKQYNTKLIKKIGKQNLNICQRSFVNQFLENDVKNQRNFLCKHYNLQPAEVIARQEHNNDLILQQSLQKSTTCTTTNYNTMTPKISHLKSKFNALTKDSSLLDSNYEYNTPEIELTNSNILQDPYQNSLRSIASDVKIYDPRMLNSINFPILKPDKELNGVRNQFNPYNSNHMVKFRSQGAAALDPSCSNIQLKDIDKYYGGTNTLVLDKASTDSSQINEKNEADPMIKHFLNDIAGYYCQYEKGCQKLAIGSTNFCMAHGGGNRCQMAKCKKGAVGGTEYCVGHGGGPRCQHSGCKKGGRGLTKYCKTHGGGLRCLFSGCKKSAASGKLQFCITHGGGHRCQFQGCNKGAIGLTKLCMGHGGGPRCLTDGCTRGAQGSTKFCKTHGGGHRCQFFKCKKSASSAKVPFCITHGGSNGKKE